MPISERLSKRGQGVASKVGARPEECGSSGGGKEEFQGGGSGQLCS